MRPPRLPARGAPWPAPPLRPRPVDPAPPFRAPPRPAAFPVPAFSPAEPETPPEEAMPEPEPLDQPTPAEEPTPTPDNSDPVTMNADAQAGGDNFGIQSGSGGGSSGVGRGGAGNATYGRYLGYLMQQAMSRDDKVKRLAFQLQVNVWLASDGRLEKVELVRGSGNEEADAAVLDALRRIGKVDQAPPPSLDFPARVLIQGRRPGA
ncbi:TonB family protein [Stenotrophomonas maltophilia]|uniref:TonB family protein n=1 Tax=Stenotrophomonas maltophilia TaxID=40324 RepID=UPI003D18C872